MRKSSAKSAASPKWFIAICKAVTTLAVAFSIWLGLLLCAAPFALAQAPVIIDTHSHLFNGGRRGGDFDGSLNAAIRRMDQYGIGQLIIMPPPMVADMPNIYDIESFPLTQKAYAGRIFAAAGGGSLNVMIHATAPDAVTEEKKKTFRTRAEQIAAAGAVAFSEIALHHLSLQQMSSRHPYEWTPPDHPLLLLLADIAAEKNIPLDLHVDMVPEEMKLPDRPFFNSTNPALLKANMAAFERLLAHNRGAKIAWAHAGTDPLGTRTPQLQRELLSRHPNLFMSLRLGGAARPPFFALAPDKKLKPAWIELLRDFPDRFVIGTDFFHSPGSGAQIGAGEETLEHYRAALAQLPAALAEAIARGNAEKIYRLRQR